MAEKSKQNQWMKDFKEFLDEADILFLTSIPLVVAFAPIIIWYFIDPYLPKISIPLPLGYFGLSIFFFIASLSGIVEIYRKEIPGPMGKNIKGKIAVISGIITAVFLLAGGFTALISAFMSLLT